MSHRFAAPAVLAVVLASASPAWAELTLPPELSPGVPALVTEPSPEPGPREPGQAEPGQAEPGPREPPSKGAKTSVKRKRPRRSKRPQRVSLDLARRGGLRAMGLAYRLFGHVDVGYSGLLGKKSGSEVHATLFTKLGRLRPMVTAGVPFYTVKGTIRNGFRGIASVEWRPIRFVGLYLDVTASYFGKALAKVEKSTVRPGAGLFLYL